jgi:hypothetical protein
MDDYCERCWQLLFHKKVGCDIVLPVCISLFVSRFSFSFQFLTSDFKFKCLLVLMIQHLGPLFAN